MKTFAESIKHKNMSDLLKLNIFMNAHILRAPNTIVYTVYTGALINKYSFNDTCN